MSFPRTMGVVAVFMAMFMGLMFISRYLPREGVNFVKSTTVDIVGAETNPHVFEIASKSQYSNRSGTQYSFHLRHGKLVESIHVPEQTYSLYDEGTFLYLTAIQKPESDISDISGTTIIWLDSADFATCLEPTTLTTCGICADLIGN